MDEIQEKEKAPPGRAHELQETPAERMARLTGGVDWTPPVPYQRRRNAGAEWFCGNYLNPLGLRPAPKAVWVLDMLGEWAAGLYNFHGKLTWGERTRRTVDRVPVKTAQWTRDGNYHTLIGGDLSSFDNEQLTRLVFLAHDWCVRVQLGARTFQEMELYLSVRDFRDGKDRSRWEYHPGLETAVGWWREARPSREPEQGEA